MKKRYNIFQKTHKSLSCLIFAAGTRIQLTDFSCPEEVCPTLQLVKQVVKYFEYHIRKEDQVVYAALASLAPYIISLLEKANAGDLCLAIDIERKLENFDCHLPAENPGEKERDLQTSFYSFTVAALQHINKEQTVINELLWDHFDDGQIREMELAIIKQLKPEERTRFTGQMISCLNDGELMSWINGYQVFDFKSDADILLQTVKSALQQDRWQYLSKKFQLQRA
jgi:hypothetical protein